MTNPIDEQMILPAQTSNQSEKLREELEYYLPFFLKSESTSVREIDPASAYRYTGDFLGLLQDQHGINPELFWLIMRMVGLKSSDEFDGEISHILVPDQSEYMRIVNTIQSKKKK